MKVLANKANSLPNGHCTYSNEGESMGIPVIRKGRTLYLTEADSARLVLQYKI